MTWSICSDDLADFTKLAIFSNVTLSNSEISSRPFYYAAVYNVTLENISVKNNEVSGPLLFDLYYVGIATLNDITISN